MGRVLILASPHEQGNDVKAFQNALTGKGYYHGPVDGIYSPLTAQAAFRAKYWLGYAKPDQVAGDRLYGFLKGAKIPLTMRLRANRRRANAPKESLGQKALAEAMKYKGVSENPPGSNHQQFGVWYGVDRVPWCAEFVSYCYVTAGSKAFQRGHRYAYVPYIANDAKAGVNHLTISHPVVAGDVITFDWDGDGVPDHTGLFVKWLDGGKTTFASIEGNTAVGNNSNGGMVCYREDRLTSEVHSFVHVGA